MENRDEQLYKMARNNDSTPIDTTVQDGTMVKQDPSVMTPKDSWGRVHYGPGDMTPGMLQKLRRRKAAGEPVSQYEESKLEQWKNVELRDDMDY